MGNEELADGIGGLVDDAARFRERAVVERQLGADGIGELAVGEPGKIVEVGGNAGGFFDVEGDDEAVGAGLEIVADFGEETALHEFVGGGLQVVFSGLCAGLQAADDGDLSLGDRFEAFGADFAEGSGGDGGGLGGRGDRAEG